MSKLIENRETANDLSMQLAALHGLLRRCEWFPSLWNGALLVDDDRLSRLGLHGRATPVDFQTSRNGVDLTLIITLADADVHI